MTTNKIPGNDRPMRCQGGLSRRVRALVMAFAVGGLAAVSASPGFAAGPDQGELKVGSKPGTIVLHWTGHIGAPMAQQIQDAFEQRKDQSAHVVLTLASGGGSVQEGEKVIQVLRRIKQTHRLQTVVGHGQMCGSMCVFIYVQGAKRTAALSSTWLFHEASKKDPTTKRTVSLDRKLWERLVDTYWVPAGVSQEWIAKMKPLTIRTDYWQTGADLVNDNSGFIHEALGNQKPRVVADGKGPAPAPRAEIQPERRRHRPDPASERAPEPPVRIAEPRRERERPRSAGDDTPPPVRIAEPRAPRPDPVSKGEPAPQPPAEARANPETPEKECKVFVPSWGVSMTLPCSAAALVK